MNSFAVIIGRRSARARPTHAADGHDHVPDARARRSPRASRSARTSSTTASSTKAEFRLDGTLDQDARRRRRATSTRRRTLGQGKHKVEVTALRPRRQHRQGHRQRRVRHGLHAGQRVQRRPVSVCVDGRCVAGPGADGGLGTTCAGNDGLRVEPVRRTTARNGYCVEACDPGRERVPERLLVPGRRRRAPACAGRRAATAAAAAPTVATAAARSCSRSASSRCLITRKRRRLIAYARHIDAPANGR